MSGVPTVTINELSNATTDPTINPIPKKVLTGILNDYMDLQFGKETPYTTGKTVIPVQCTIEDVDHAIEDKTVEKKFTDIFRKISDTYKSGDLTPQSQLEGLNPKFKPVFIFVTPSH